MGLTFSGKLAKLPHYEAGTPIADARERYGVADVVKLASNESPYPPVQAVRGAIAEAAQGLHRYPDPAAKALRRALADHYDLPIEHIAVGNGSCELLLAAAEAILEPGGEIVYAWPAFSIYPHLAALSGAETRTVALAEGDVHDLDAMLAAVSERARIAIVCNPNNPTATYIESRRIADFLDAVPSHVCVILDEAYIEYQTVESPDCSLDLMRRFPNVVVLRTFSKVYGLSGLRCGYALCSEQFRNAVDRVRQPFSVNALAQVAATVALKHQDDVVRRAERNASERMWVEEELARLALAQTRSQANFSWVDLGDRSERDVVEGLAHRGVVVRGGEGLGAAGHFRVTYGTRRENERFIAALEEVLAQADNGGAP